MLILSFLVIFLFNYSPINGEATSSTSGFLCGLFPEAVKEKCNNFFKDDKENVQLSISANINLEMQKGDGDKMPFCKICLKLINELLNRITEKTEPEIRRALEGICKIFKGPSRKFCKDIVEKFADMIVREILSNYGAETICHNMNLCLSESKKIAMNQEEKGTMIEVKNDMTSLKKIITCIPCIRIVYGLEKILNHSFTAIQVEKKLENLLTVVKSPYKEYYTRGLRKYGIVVIQRLLNKDKPRKICRDLRLCRMSEIFAAPSKGVKSLQGDCSICQKISKKLDLLIDQHPNDMEISKMLDSVCYFLSSAEGSECQSFIMAHKIEMMNLITNGKSVDIICSYMKGCGTTGDNSEDLLYWIPFQMAANEENTVL